MHNAAIEALGIDWCYVAFDVLPENVEDTVRGIRGLGMGGTNVTIPHKMAVMEFLDEISQEAQAVGAVNTIANTDGKLTGHNTDVYGFLESLRREGGKGCFAPKVVVLGAGGAARAVIYGLTTVDEVEEILILNRTAEKAEKLKDEFSNRGKGIRSNVLQSQVLKDELKDCELLINVTSVGMHPNVDASPLCDGSGFHSRLVVFDSVPNPAETKLMSEAKSRGAKVIGGLDMLVLQGARSFQIWTGIEPPTDVMKRSLIERFK